MGYYLPNFNFALTDKLRKKQEAVKPIVQDTLIAEKRYEMGGSYEQELYYY